MYEKQTKKTRCENCGKFIKHLHAYYPQGTKGTVIICGKCWLKWLKDKPLEKG